MPKIQVKIVTEGEKKSRISMPYRSALRLFIDGATSSLDVIGVDLPSELKSYKKFYSVGADADAESLRRDLLKIGTDFKNVVVYGADGKLIPKERSDGSKSVIVRVDGTIELPSPKRISNKRRVKRGHRKYLRRDEPDI